LPRTTPHRRSSLAVTARSTRSWSGRARTSRMRSCVETASARAAETDRAVSGPEFARSQSVAAKLFRLGASVRHADALPSARAGGRRGGYLLEKTNPTPYPLRPKFEDLQNCYFGTSSPNVSTTDFTNALAKYSFW